jgi:siroheme synthase
VRCEIVPGVSAAFAASAALGVSLTERGVSRSVVFATPRIGHGAPSDRAWLASALAADTAALYMAGEHAAEIAVALVAGGKPAHTPIVVVASASLPEQSVHATTLGALAESRGPSAAGPTLLLIGQVYARSVARAASGAIPLERATAAR